MVSNQCLSVQFESIPVELKARCQWVCWKTVVRDGKPTKPPYRLSGSKGDSTDPEAWASFEAAWQAYTAGAHGFEGIGFAFSPEDPYTGIDLDKCRNPETGAIEPWAKKIIDRLDSYTELSPSGRGVHILVKGRIPGTRRRTGNVEMYDRGRFFTVTGVLIGTCKTIEARQPQLDTLYEEVFQPKPMQAQDRKPTPAQPVALADAELLEKARTAKNGHDFDRLWRGDTSGYSSQSEADLALCCHLAFWVGRDPARIDGLFRQSKLCRDKWDRQDYRERTLTAAIESTTEVYAPSMPSRNGSRPDNPWPDYSRSLTDMGNGQRLINQYGRDLKYCQSLANRWLFWDGSRWLPDEVGKVHQLAKRTVLTIYAEAADVSGEGREAQEKRDAIVKHARASQASSRINAMLDQAWSEPGIPVHHDALDTDGSLFNCLNATIDPRTGVRREHDRANLITKLAPVIFDREATCSLWLSFLDRVFAGDTDLISFVQRAVGYSLTGDTSEQVLFILWGSGSNGKTVFVETISALMGDYAQEAEFESFLIKKGDAIRNDLAAMRGSRFISANEMEQGRRLAESVVKQITGQGKIRCRFLHRESFQYQPTYKIFLATNHRPRIRGRDHAIWRRIRLIPFNVTIPDDEQDRRLAEKLRSELSGILNWALEGCRSWRRNGLGYPEPVRTATEKYKSESDYLGEFLQDVTFDDSDGHATHKNLYKSYQQWCKENGETAFGSKTFSQMLEERGYERAEKLGPAKKDRGFKGLELLPGWPRNEFDKPE